MFGFLEILRAAKPLCSRSIVRGLVLQEWAQSSSGWVEKVKMASRESGWYQGWVGNSGRISWSKLNYWVVLAALTVGNEPLNLEEERRRRSKLHFRGGNHASFAKHDFLSRGSRT